jgi:GntR family transcriptional repressor for pyruvate dehydrogenase complex
MADIEVQRAGRVKSLSEHVAQTLSAAIRNGSHALGEALPPEAVMAKSYGVSRPVMREAIARLQAEGLVQVKHGLGVYVTPMMPATVFKLDANLYRDADEILDIIRLRIGLEAEAAALAAQSRLQADVAIMRETLDRMLVSFQSGDIASGVQADVQFHRAICVATHNRHYVSFFDSLQEFMLRSINYLCNYAWALDKTGLGVRSQAEHEAIFRAIQDGKPELARAGVRVHLEGSARRIATSGR